MNVILNHDLGVQCSWRKFQMYPDFMSIFRLKLSVWPTVVFSNYKYFLLSNRHVIYLNGWLHAAQSTWSHRTFRRTMAANGNDQITNYGQLLGVDGFLTRKLSITDEWYQSVDITWQTLLRILVSSSPVCLILIYSIWNRKVLGSNHCASHCWWCDMAQEDWFRTLCSHIILWPMPWQ